MNALILAAALALGCPCGCDETGVCSCDVCGSATKAELLPAPLAYRSVRVKRAFSGEEGQACGAGNGRRFFFRREYRRGSCSDGSCSMTATRTVTFKKFSTRSRSRGGCANCR